MKFKHRDGEDAAGETVSVSTHLKPEVSEDGVFEVDSEALKQRGVDPMAARSRLIEAGHDEVGEKGDDVSDSDSDGEDDETGSDSGQVEDEGASKTELMNYKKDHLLDMAEAFDDVDTDQNKEPLAEDLAGRVVIEDEEGEE